MNKQTARMNEMQTRVDIRLSAGGPACLTDVLVHDTLDIVYLSLHLIHLRVTRAILIVARHGDAEQKLKSSEI